MVRMHSGKQVAAIVHNELAETSMARCLFSMSAESSREVMIPSSIYASKERVESADRFVQAVGTKPKWVHGRCG